MGLVKGILQGEIISTETNEEDLLLVTVAIPRQHLDEETNPLHLQGTWVGIIPEEMVNRLEEKQKTSPGESENA